MAEPSKPEPPKCAGCGRPERGGWLKFLTRLTACTYCGRLLCPNCFEDPCDSSPSEEHEPQEISL